MIITVKVNTTSKKESIDKIAEDSYRVSFKAEREKGKANVKLVQLLANYFNVSQLHVKIIKGFTNKAKVVKISNTI